MRIHEHIVHEQVKSMNKPVTDAHEYKHTCINTYKNR